MPEPGSAPFLAQGVEQNYSHMSPLGNGNNPAPFPSHDVEYTEAQSVKNQYRRSLPSDPLPQGDIGQQSNHTQYSNPYQTERSMLDRKPSTVGPWDSASQHDMSISDARSDQPHPRGALGDQAEDQRHVHQKPSYAGGLSYIDEEGAYYRSDERRPASYLDSHRDDVEMRGLVGGAAGMGGADHERKYGDFDDSPSAYPEPPLTKGVAALREPSNLHSWLLFPTGLDRLMALFGLNAGKYPLQQATERKRRGVGGQRWPIAAWTLTVGGSVFVHRNAKLTGSHVRFDGV